MAEQALRQKYQPHYQEAYETASNWGRGFSIFAALGSGIIGGVFLWLSFPTWGLWTIAFGFGAFFADLIVTWRSVAESFGNLFAKGPFRHLEEQMLVKSLSRNQGVRDAIKKKLMFKRCMSIKRFKKLNYTDEEYAKTDSKQWKSDKLFFQTRFNQTKEYMKTAVGSPARTGLQKDANDRHKTLEFLESVKSTITEEEIDEAILRSIQKWHDGHYDYSSENHPFQNEINAYLEENAGWMTWRKTLTVLSFIFAIGNAIAFGAMTFVSAAEVLFGMAGIAIPAGVTATTLIGAPWFVLLPSFFIAIPAMFAFSMLMYNVMEGLICLDMQSVSESIYEFYVPHDDNGEPIEDFDVIDWFLHVLKVSFKTVCFIGIVGIAIFVNTATAGAFMESMAATFTFCAHQAAMLTGVLITSLSTITHVATMISLALTMLLILPVNFAFSSENGVGSVNKIIDIILGIPGYIVSGLSKIREKIIGQPSENIDDSDNSNAPLIDSQSPDKATDPLVTPEPEPSLFSKICGWVSWLFAHLLCWTSVILHAICGGAIAKVGTKDILNSPADSNIFNTTFKMLDQKIPIESIVFPLSTANEAGEHINFLDEGGADFVSAIAGAGAKAGQSISNLFASRIEDDASEKGPEPDAEKQDESLMSGLPDFDESSVALKLDKPEALKAPPNTPADGVNGGAEPKL